MEQHFVSNMQLGPKLFPWLEQETQHLGKQGEKGINQETTIRQGEKFMELRRPKSTIIFCVIFFLLSRLNYMLYIAACMGAGIACGGSRGWKKCREDTKVCGDAVPERKERKEGNKGTVDFQVFNGNSSPNISN